MVVCSIDTVNRIKSLYSGTGIPGNGILGNGILGYGILGYSILGYSILGKGHCGVLRSRCRDALFRSMAQQRNVSAVTKRTKL